MLSINTNVFSLTAQAALSNTQNPLQTSMERLSTGLRINSAADDAAGLAIATGLQSQINGMNTAITNANNGVGLLQTAQGALTSITNNLQSIRDLAVEASNATNNSTDLASLNTEAQQLLSEINRVASTTQFNNVNLLDGSFQNETFQVGANAGQTITISAIASALTSGTNSSAFTETGAAITGVLTASTLSINGVAIGSSVAGNGVTGSTGFGMDQTASSAWAIANAINAAVGTNVTAIANATVNSGGAAVTVLAPSVGIAAGNFKINGVSVGSIAGASDSFNQAVNIANAFNALSTQTGVTATVTASGTNGYLTLTDSEGGSVKLADTSGASGITAGDIAGTVTLSSNSNVIVVGSGLGANGSSGGAVSVGLVDQTYTNTGGATTTGTGLGLSGISLLTQTDASGALSMLDAALSSVNSSNASLGAYQNRFQSAVTTLQNTSNNLSSAKSNIMDADYATETSNMTKAMIAQQAGISVLAQANTIPQEILALLPKG